MSTATAIIPGRYGWLSPEGVLFENGWAGHYDNAQDIFETKFADRAKAIRERDGYVTGERELVKLGWVRIGSNGLVTDHNWDTIPAYELTQDQFNWLDDAARVAEGVENLKEFAGRLRKSMHNGEKRGTIGE